MNHEPQTFADLQDTGNAQSQLVLQAVARHSDWVTGKCHPRVEVLARMSKCSDKTVRRHLKKMEADGFITIEERSREDGSQGANLITLVGYAEWIKANRDGGTVAKPRKAPRYREHDIGTDAGTEPQENGPGQVDQAAGPDHSKAPKMALVDLTTGQAKMTSGRGQQLSTPKNTFSEQDSPQPPNGGLSRNTGDEQWKAGVLATLHAENNYGDSIKHLIAPLLASSRRLRLGKDPLGELRALALVASDVNGEALATAVKRLCESQKTLSPMRIRAAVDDARVHGAMVVIKPGMTQWQRWVEYFERIEPQRARAMVRLGVSQVPSEWPPAQGRAA